MSYRVENDSTLENVVNVTFVINRNRRVKIGDIVFDGNEAISDEAVARRDEKDAPQEHQLPAGERS